MKPYESKSTYLLLVFAALFIVLASPAFTQDLYPLSADSKLQQGMDYFNDGKLWEATLVFEEVIKEAPTHPKIGTIRYVLGYSYLQLGRAKDAERVLEKALDEVENRSDVLLALAQSRLLQEKYQPATNNLEEYMELKPADLSSLGTLCTLYLKIEDYEKAEPCLSRVLETAGDNPEMLLHYGMILLNNGKGKEALDTLQKAKQLDAELEDVDYYIGLAAYQSGATETARIEFEHLYEQGKADVKILGALGSMAAQTEDYKNAEKYFFASYKDQPDNREILNNLVVCKIKLGKVDEAVSLLQDVLKKNKNDSEILSMLVSIYLQFERIDEAKELLEQLVEIEPKNPDYLKILAAIYDQGFDTEKIVSTWRAYLNLKPGDTQARVSLAKALKKSGDKEAALAEYEKIISKDMKEETAFREAGLLCEDLGMTDRATGIYEKMNSLFPDSAFASARLGEIADKSGDTKAADKFYSAALKKPEMKDLYVYNRLAEIRYNQGRQLEAELLYRQGLEKILEHTEEVFMGFMTSMEQNGGALDLMQLIEISEREKNTEKELDTAMTGVHAAFSERDAEEEEIEYLLGLTETYKSNKKPALFAARLLKEMGDPEGRIIGICEKILKIDVKEPEAHMLMGWAYDKKGDIKEAGKAYKRAVEADPENKSAWDALIANYGKQKRTAELLPYAEQKLKDKSSSETLIEVVSELKGNTGQISRDSTID